MRILIAPNAFKNSIDAVGAALAIEEGFRQSDLNATCIRMPVADGGDGTLGVLHHISPFEIIEQRVKGPYGNPVPASWGWIENTKTAVIEMAEASGLKRAGVTPYDPMRASTYGCGELLSAALGRGVRRVIIGLGGSATIDAGLGFVQAMGAVLFDSSGAEVGQDGNPLLRVCSMDISAMSAVLEDVELIALVDVDNPLTGPDGAVAVFGPQKGARAEQLPQLEYAMQRYAGLLGQFGGPDAAVLAGGGAAGGFGATLAVLCGARLERGAEYLMDMQGFDDALGQCHLVVTAEGKADGQSIRGKGPGAVAQRAAAMGKPVLLLAGIVEYGEAIDELYTAAFSICNGPKTLEESIISTDEDLRRTAREIGNLLALGVK